MRRGRGKCSHCGRVFGAYVPAGGDGSALVARFHHGPTTFDFKRCPGVGMEVKEIVEEHHATRPRRAGA